MSRMKDYFRKSGTVVNWWNPEDPAKDDMAHIYRREICLVKEIVKGFGPRKKALELSPGKGRLAAAIHNIFDEFWGVDISEDMIRVIQQRVPEVRMLLGDVGELSEIGIEDDCFDAVFCLEALVHYPNPDQAISEMYRVLKPRGNMVLTFDNKGSIQRMVRRCQHTCFRLIDPGYQSKGSGIYRPLRKEDVLGWVEGAGFGVKDVYSLGAIPTVKLRSMDGNKKWYIISPKVSERLESIDIMMCKLPSIKDLATYYVVHAVK